MKYRIYYRVTTARHVDIDCGGTVEEAKAVGIAKAQEVLGQSESLMFDSFSAENLNTSAINTDTDSGKASDYVGVSLFGSDKA